MDSSPQLGANYLCLREDRIRIPRGQYNEIMNPMTDLSNHFESRICSASVIGHKNANLVKKTSNVANTYLSESDSVDMFFEKRCEVRGAVTDQGTEKGIGDDTVRGVHGRQDYTSDNEDDIFT